MIYTSSLFSFASVETIVCPLVFGKNYTFLDPHINVEFLYDEAGLPLGPPVHLSVAQNQS